MTSESDYSIAAIDLGNSKVKLFLDEKDLAFDYHGEWQYNLIKLIVGAEKARIFIGVSSVRPERYSELIKVGESVEKLIFFNLKESFCDIPAGIRTSVHGFGADRLLGLYGALLHSTPPLFTVDCGTAITINFLDSSLEFCGGAILPGIGTQLRALHEFTEQLPSVVAAVPASYLGTATAHAMLSGVVGGAAGAVRTLIERMWRESQGRGTPTIFITGGEAELLLAQLSDWSWSVVHAPRLVREGVVDVTRRLVEHKQPGTTQ